MISLLELQRTLGAALLSGSGAAAAAIVPNGIAPADRLNVYRNNVIGNLTGALKLTFPVIERLVGRDFFAASAMRFMAVEPPRQANLYDWGDRFAAFLEEFPPAASLPYLADVARLEWAVGRAVHAPEAPTLSLLRLAQIAAAPKALVRFRVHPSVSLLALAHPAHGIWRAVLARDDAALRAIDPASGGEQLIVHRSSAGAGVLPVSVEGLRFGEALCRGMELSEALGLVSADAAASLLGQFIACGLFSGVLGRPDAS